jgi:hypothetical protein
MLYKTKSKELIMKIKLSNFIKMIILFFISTNIFAEYGDLNWTLNTINEIDSINEAHNTKLFIIISVVTIILLLAKIAFKNSSNDKKKTDFKETSDDKMVRYTIIFVCVVVALCLLLGKEYLI